MKILLTEAAALVYKNDVSLDLFHNLGEFLRFENISREELLNQVKDTDVILCNKVLIDAEVMDKAPRLKYIGTCATGYNNVDIIEAKKLNKIHSAIIPDTFLKVSGRNVTHLFEKLHNCRY